MIRAIAIRAGVVAAAKKATAVNGEREETPAEIQWRFAQMRHERSKEYYGPRWPDGTNITYGDNADEITDEELEYGCLGISRSTPPEKRAAILADPFNRDKVKKCEELKARRDSKTRQEKREARQKVNGYMLTYSDDTPEEAAYWERKKQEYRRNNPGWKTWF